MEDNPGTSTAPYFSVQLTDDVDMVRRMADSGWALIDADVQSEPDGRRGGIIGEHRKQTDSPTAVSNLLLPGDFQASYIPFNCSPGALSPIMLSPHVPRANDQHRVLHEGPRSRSTSSRRPRSSSGGEELTSTQKDTGSTQVKARLVPITDRQQELKIENQAKEIEGLREEVS